MSLVPLLTMIMLVPQPLLPQEADMWVSKKNMVPPLLVTLSETHFIIYFPVKVDTKLILHFS